MSAKLTPPACRAARALLGWSKRDLAEAASIALGTVQKVETGGDFFGSTEAKIVEAFARHNVEITNGNGTGARLLSK